MAALLGSSGAPRWYQGGPERLDAYIAALREWGATSMELPLHHGPADERTARVHVLEPDWDRMLARYRAAGLALQFHVSLDPRFATSRWLTDAEGLRREYRPLMRVAGEVAAEQGGAVLVVHGASDPRRGPEENREATIALLRWLAEESERGTATVRIALELRADRDYRPSAAAVSRQDVLEVVRAVDSPRVGVCWDLAHDRENAAREPGWEPVPSPEFLARVIHVHLHDIDDAGEDHNPPVFARVPFPEQLDALARTGSLPPVTMEVRWRCAARLGDPWDLLGRSYRIVGDVLATAH